MISTSFVQPFFSANYLSLQVHPTPQGGLSNGTTVEIRFKDRGMFQWVSMLDATRSQALLQKREERLGEPLPLYEPPPTSTGEQIATTNSARQPSDQELPSYSA
ncbi:hypothetical protein FRC03_007868 [Tulasnella sp. 419]|nr:hypothetical protein FRC03_007868 [Tulasnella sp. 419]